MKKIYSFIMVLFVLAGTNKTNAQAGSVTLTPNAGSPVSYASLTSAYAAIPSGTTTSYTIELLAAYAGTDASEVYPIQLTDKGLTPGGAVTITIRPAAGNNGETIVRPTAGTVVVLQFNGADNVILDGRPGGVTSNAANYLSVNDVFSGSNTNRNIELLNAANNNTIQYVNCNAADATAAGAGNRTILVGSTTTTGNLNNTIQNCVVTGGLRAIQDFGLSDAVPNTGTKILNNTVRNFGGIGIFAGSGQANITVQNNTVSMAGYNVLVTSAVVTGIQQQSTVPANAGNISNNLVSLNTISATVTNLTGITDISSGNETIFRNTISTLSAPLTGTAVTNFLVGISIGAATGGTIATHNVSNNYISGLSSTGVVNIRAVSAFPFAGSTINLTNNSVAVTDLNPSASAIFGLLMGNTAGSNYTSNIYYNSIRLGGNTSATTVNTYGIYKSDANATSVYNQKNNIAVVDRSFAVGFLLGSATGTMAIDYNNYYGTGAANSSFAGGSPTTYYDNTQLAAYKAAVAPQDANSTFSPVIFVGSTDLHLSGTSITDATLKGTPIAGITTDYDGNTRSTTAPAKGADEPGGAVPVQLFTFSGSAKGAVNQLLWSTASESNNAGFELQRSADGRNFSALTFVESKSVNGNSTTQLNYAFDDAKPFISNSYYRLRQVDKDGRSTYSAVVNIKGKGVSGLQITNLYPNPVVDQFNLVMGAKANGSVIISIIALDGKQVARQTFAVQSGDNILTMNARTLTAGVYTIKAIDNATGEVTTLKFTK